MTFTEQVSALYGQYDKNIKKIRDDSTIEIFTYAFKKPNNQVRPTTIKNIKKGCFYIIRYDFNGNKIWCPIFAIDYKVIENKKILYAVNFDFLPIKYKIFFIDSMLGDVFIADKNSDTQYIGKTVLAESGIRNTNFENIYKFLKSNANKEYSITAYDLLKIDKIYAVSTTILQRFVFIDTYYINKKMMLETLLYIEDQKIKQELMIKIKKYEELSDMYNIDIENYYKALKNFESNLKLS